MNMIITINIIYINVMMQTVHVRVYLPYLEDLISSIHTVTSLLEIDFILHPK